MDSDLWKKNGIASVEFNELHRKHGQPKPIFVECEMSWPSSFHNCKHIFRRFGRVVDPSHNSCSPEWIFCAMAPRFGCAKYTHGAAMTIYNDNLNESECYECTFAKPPIRLRGIRLPFRNRRIPQLVVNHSAYVSNFLQAAHQQPLINRQLHLPNAMECVGDMYSNQFMIVAFVVVVVDAGWLINNLHNSRQWFQCRMQLWKCVARRDDMLYRCLHDQSDWWCETWFVAKNRHLM